MTSGGADRTYGLSAVTATQRLRPPVRPNWRPYGQCTRCEAWGHLSETCRASIGKYGESKQRWSSYRYWIPGQIHREQESGIRVTGYVSEDQ